jgi:hypothetical protein
MTKQTALTSSVNIQSQNYRVFMEQKINRAFGTSGMRRCVLRRAFLDVSKEPGVFVFKRFVDMFKVLSFQENVVLGLLNL